MRAALGLVLLTTLLRPTPVDACAPVFPQGKRVSIDAEEALIVWDPEAGVEHFIRRASFRTDADDFGFLVPTPSVPELSEVDNHVFDRLTAYQEPEVRYTHAWDLTTCCAAPLSMMLAREPQPLAAAAMPEAVQVLAQARVAGLDATVLRASDPEELSAWLGEHGYEDRSELVAWLAPYVADGYAITAFRFQKSDTSSENIGSRAVRMTFETERPFYPYREPTDSPEEPYRALWLDIVAPARASGRLLADGEWAPETLFAAPIDDPARLLGDARSDVNGPLWLTTIIDRSVSRADADLVFDVAPGEELRPPPRIIRGEAYLIPIPIRARARRRRGALVVATSQEARVELEREVALVLVRVGRFLGAVDVSVAARD